MELDPNRQDASARGGVAHETPHTARRHILLTVGAAILLSCLPFIFGKTGTQYFLFAATAGILPAFFWLWFWLREDRLHPEPKNVIFSTFFLGALMVPFAIVFENAFNYFVVPVSFMALLAWSAIEEVLKYFAAFFGGLRTKYFDEPIDAVIYLLSAALGFAAVENVLFIFSSLMDGGMLESIAVTHIRFIGPSLLHIAASSVVGFAIGFSIVWRKFARIMALLVGLSLATALHVFFNFSIIGGNGYDAHIMLWVTIVVVMLLFERIKLPLISSHLKKLFK